MIYITCKYAPAELFAGFDETVERLDPSPANFECADACAHANLCGFSKAVIEEVRARGIRRLVLTDCCDAMRRTYDVLQAEGQMEFLYLLSLPHKRTEAEVRLFEQALGRLRDAYAAFSGRTFDSQKATDEYMAGHAMREPLPQGRYVRLTGAHGGQQLLARIRQLYGDLPVVDETCTGNRYLRQEAGDPEDFLAWYAPALLKQDMPCMRMWYGGGRVRDDAGQPIGTICHTMKFCDYYGFEYLQEKEAAGMPLLKIETDATPQSSGQLKTRLEAFREELGAAKIPAAASRPEGPIYSAGIDSGSASTDAVIMDADRKILGRAIVETGSGAASGAREALQSALQEAGLTQKDLAVVVTTGYGRDSIGVDSIAVTEITCHARGAGFLIPSARTVIDIGGQDSKVIRIDEHGNVQNFVMNDKCAAGTGRFLEMQARAMGLSMEQMSRKGLEWRKPVTISSMCTVFAESEVVSLVAQNVDPSDIVHGLNMAIAARTAALVKRLGLEKEVTMTGGVARNEGVVLCLEEKLGQHILVSPDAQLCGSIGAALIGLEHLEQADGTED